jgi:hypothetical protein
MGRALESRKGLAVVWRKWVGSGADARRAVWKAGWREVSNNIVMDGLPVAARLASGRGFDIVTAGKPCCYTGY